MRLLTVAGLGVLATLGPAFIWETGLDPLSGDLGLNIRFLGGLVAGAAAGAIWLGATGWVLFAGSALVGAMVEEIVWVYDASLRNQVAAALLVTAFALIAATPAYVGAHYGRTLWRRRRPA